MLQHRRNTWSGVERRITRAASVLMILRVPGPVLMAFCTAMFLALYFDVILAQDDTGEFRLTFGFPSKQERRL